MGAWKQSDGWIDRCDRRLDHRLHKKKYERMMNDKSERELLEI